MFTESIYTILEYIRQGRCSLFVGSGLASICGMPSSPELAKQIAEYLKSSFPDLDTTTIEKNEADLGKISQLYQKVSRDDFAPHRFIQDRLLQAQERVDTTLYQKLAKIAFPYIITTNYDRLIEQTRKTEIRIRNIARDNASASNITLGRETILVKMHGDIENYQSMIITEAELHEFRKRAPNIVSLVLQVLTQGSVLFLGFSKTTGSFIDIAVDYISGVPEKRSAHPWFIVDRRPLKQLIASLNNENSVLIEEDIHNFVQKLCDAFSVPDFIDLPPHINLYEVLHRLSFQIKEMEKLLADIKADYKLLEAPHQQFATAIHLMNEYEGMQTEVNILESALESIEEIEREKEAISPQDVDSSLEEATDFLRPVKSKVDREARERIEEFVVGKTSEMGRLIDDDEFHKRGRRYLKVFKPKYGDKSYSSQDIEKQEDEYADVLTLWKDNRQSEFFTEYYIKKYEELDRVWPPKGRESLTIEEIQQFVPVEGSSEVYRDSVFCQNVKPGLQRLKGGLEDNLKYYRDKGLLGTEPQRPSTAEKILEQKIKELSKQLIDLKGEIDKKRNEGK